MSEWNECSSSESPCPHNASQQVSASCDLCSGADVVSRFSNWPPWQPSWIMEWKNFSNSKSPCHPNASHQVRAQSDLLFAGRYGLKIFKMATVVAILDIRKILAILNLCVATRPPIKFQLNQTYGLGVDFGSHLGYWNTMILAILIIHVAPMPPTKFGINLTEFGSRCGFKIFKMAAQAASSDNRTKRF